MDGATNSPEESRTGSERAAFQLAPERVGGVSGAEWTCQIHFCVQGSRPEDCVGRAKRNRGQNWSHFPQTSQQQECRAKMQHRRQFPDCTSCHGDHLPQNVFWVFCIHYSTYFQVLSGLLLLIFERIYLKMKNDNLKNTEIAMYVTKYRL